MWWLRRRDLRISLLPNALAILPSQGEGTIQRLASNAMDWRPVVAAMKDDLRLRPKGCLSIALSLQWCRFLSLPWSDAWLGTASAASYCTDQFRAVFGGTDEWFHFAEDHGPGRPRLVGAIPAELHAALLDLPGRHRLQAIMPWPVAALNHYRRRLGPCGWFAALEEGRGVLVELQGGTATQILGFACGDTPLAEVLRQRRRAVLRGGQETDQPLYLFDACARVTEDAQVHVFANKARPRDDWPLVTAECLP